MNPAGTHLRTLVAATAAWLLVSFGAATYAAASDANEEDAVSAGTAASEGSAETDEERGESGEVFIPTEEISEDFAVSFPVDI